MRKCIYGDVMPLEDMPFYQNLRNSIIHNTHCVFSFCICACLGDDGAFKLIFMYSNSSLHISHINAFGIYTNYSSSHLVISHHMSPPPALPSVLLHDCKVRLDLSIVLYVWCADSSYHALSQNK